MYRWPVIERIIIRLYSRPELFLLLTFLLLISGGTLLLSLPGMAHTRLGFVNALFTATSAVCVTGLVVLDTGKDFTLMGQLVILTLIQLGALGIMTFSASLLVSMGRQVRSHQMVALGQLMDQESIRELKSSIGFIFKATFALEAIGVFLLSAYWAMRQGFGIRSLYYGLFHSVSAFCNAGFSLFSDSFTRWRGDAFVNVVMTVLIVCGGLGFVVLQDLFAVFSRQSRRLRLQSKVVLVTYLLLFLVGAFGLMMTERTMLSALPLKERILSAMFQSVNARTAGFNSLEIGNISLAGKWLLMFLMFVGASSGSTGGGIKVTTFSVLVLSAVRYLRGHQDVVVFGRTLVADVVHKAWTIFLFGLTMLFLGTFFLSLSDPRFGLDRLFFEAVSAFGTVGLSTGITPSLSRAGKLVLSLLMLIGRLGPLTIALAFVRKDKKAKLRFASGRMMVG